MTTDYFKRVESLNCWVHTIHCEPLEGGITNRNYLVEHGDDRLIIGENGIRLSGGEKQRLSIARAMLKKSPIILLDEATSSLDAETENKIQKAVTLLTKNRTTVVIAHRLSTILNSDRIYVIDKGQVVGEGKHEELLANLEIYKNFYNKQVNKG